jgi:hypothetical protein
MPKLKLGHQIRGALWFQRHDRFPAEIGDAARQRRPMGRRDSQLIRAGELEKSSSRMPSIRR